MNDSLESCIELLVAEVAQSDQVDVRRSRIGRDLLIVVERASPEPHRLTLRVQEGGVLLDIDDSQAMEFAGVDDGDMADLADVVRAYCLGELEVGVRDGKYHALRTTKTQLSSQESVFGLFRSRREEWRRIG